MDKTSKQLVVQIKENLIKDLILFLKEPTNFSISKKIDAYCSDALNDLIGFNEPTQNFSEFIDILYGCQQLDDFGESWAPTKEKVQNWLKFLEKFKIE